MKLSKSLVLGVILLFILIIGAYCLFAGSGQSNFRSKSGFRGLKWGAPRSEHEGSPYFVEDGMSRYFNLYFISGDNNFLGEVPLSSIHYSFIIDNGVERFESVQISVLFSGKYDSKILEILKNQYGESTGKKQSASGEFYIFEDNYVTVRYWPKMGWRDSGYITISSKEMRSVYSELWKKIAEEQEQKKAEF